MCTNSSRQNNKPAQQTPTTPHQQRHTNTSTQHQRHTNTNTTPTQRNSLDAARPSFGELPVLSQLGEALGKGVWRSLMVVLTHANAARDKLASEYGATMRQRRNILGNIMRQVSGEMQLKTPTFLADSHPDCPHDGQGRAVVFDAAGGGLVPGALAPAPWREQLLMQLLGYGVYQKAQAAAAAAQPKPKGKAAAGAAGALSQQQQMMQRMRRSRMPPTSYFVEQLVEGVLKPDTWATVEDPFDQETDDEDAEEFNTRYYSLMRAWARQGDPRAQKEYGAWLRRLARARRAYAEAYRNEDNETMAAYGYEVSRSVGFVGVVAVCCCCCCLLLLLCCCLCCLCCLCWGAGGVEVVPCVDRARACVLMYSHQHRPAHPPPTRSSHRAPINQPPPQSPPITIATTTITSGLRRRGPRPRPDLRPRGRDRPPLPVRRRRQRVPDHADARLLRVGKDKTRWEGGGDGEGGWGGC